MRYIGSKTLLLNEIATVVKSCTDNGIFCDPFGGIGTVGNYMKKMGYTVITGDILNFAHFFQIALIENCGQYSFEKLKASLQIVGDDELEKILSSVELSSGWLIDEYAIKRNFFTHENACNIQGCIFYIEKWKKEKLINDGEYAILIASLIHSLDKVANTAGTYYAYLKEYHRKARAKFNFTMLKHTNGKKDCKSFLLDANDLVRKIKCDVLYLDPPYNERNYARYYHLPETISLGIVPNPVGKSGVFTPHDNKSKYNSKYATQAFENLIKCAQTKFIIFHYTDDGIIKVDDARRVLKEKGKVEEFYLNCKGYNNTSHNYNNSKHHIFKVIV